MKIMFALLLVFVALVGMVFTFAWMDGEFGDSPFGTSVNADGPITGVEKSYLEFMIAHLDMSASEISNLGVLFSNSDFENQEWQAAVYLTVSRIQAAFANVVNLEPTERLVPFHESALSTLSHSAKFGELVDGIVSSGSSQLTDEAVRELLALGQGFVETETLLDEFLDAHPVPEELSSSDRQDAQTSEAG